MLIRLPSLFFMCALAFYYIPKLANKKHKIFIKLHIFMGMLASVAMLLVMITKVGTAELMKYIGFSAIMIAITLTGVGLIEGKAKMRKLHILTTVGFFAYLLLIILL